jgi:hypothetical protein
MSSLALSPHRPCGGTTAGILNSALVSLAFVSLTSEWNAIAGRPLLIAVDVVVGVLGMAVPPLVHRAPARLALALSALLTVSVTLTPMAGTAMLWVARRRPLPIAIAVALTGVAGHLVRETWRPEPGRPFLLWLTFIAASYAALVAWGALSRARNTAHPAA